MLVIMLHLANNTESTVIYSDNYWVRRFVSARIVRYVCSILFRPFLFKNGVHSHLEPLKVHFSSFFVSCSGGVHIGHRDNHLLCRNYSILSSFCSEPAVCSTSAGFYNNATFFLLSFHRIKTHDWVDAS